jgi:hypothetical protein
MDMKERVEEMEKQVAQKKRLAEIKFWAEQAKMQADGKKPCGYDGARALAGHIALGKKQYQEAFYCFVEALGCTSHPSAPIGGFMRERALVGLERMIDTMIKHPPQEGVRKHYEIVEGAIKRLKQYHPELKEE